MAHPSAMSVPRTSCCDGGGGEGGGGSEGKPCSHSSTLCEYGTGACSVKTRPLAGWAYAWSANSGGASQGTES